MGRKTRLVGNQHIQYFPYIRRLVRLSQTVEQDNLFIVFDLTRVYHHVSMHASPPQIFGIFIQLSQQSGMFTRYFQFNVSNTRISVPIALGECQELTKLTRPSVAYRLGMDILAYIYIDDGIFNSNENAISHSRIMPSTLESSGFVINAEKFNWALGLWTGQDFILT